MVKYIASVGTIGLAEAGVFNNISLALFNLPILVPIMAACGAMLSFAYDDDSNRTKTKLTKKRAVVLVLANTFLTTAAICVLPEWLGWSWYNPKLQGSLALLLAASARFIIPLVIKTLPEIVRKWFKVGEYKNNSSTEDTNEESK